MDHLPKEKFYTVSEAAGYIGISINTLKRWEEKGKIVVGRTPTGTRVYRKEDLDRIKGTFIPYPITQQVYIAPKIQKPKTDHITLSPRHKFIFLTMTILIILFGATTLTLFQYSPLPGKAVLGIETFIAPAMEEVSPVLSPIVRFISQAGRNISAFLIAFLPQTSNQTAITSTLPEGIKINGNNVILGFPNLGTTTVNNDFEVIGTSTLLSVNVQSDLNVDGNTTLQNLTTKNITSTGNISATGNITGSNLTISTINNNTFSSSTLVFQGTSPSIYPSTTNSQISLNSNGTGAINIGNSSTGDIYLGGGSSGTGCTLTNSDGSFNCSGDITTGGKLYVNGTSLATNQTTFNLLNQTALTINLGGEATTLSIGAATGTTTINNALTVMGSTSLTTTLSVAGTSTFAGRPTFTKAPSLAHTGTWAIGSSAWNQSDASVYINPATIGAADNNLLGIAVNGSVKFAVDSEGDTYVNNLILAGSITSATTTIAGDLTVEGNTILGDATTDTLTLNPATLTWAGGNKTLDITGAATRTLTILNSTGGQVADLNLSDGSLYTNATQRLDNSGNLSNIGTISLSGQLTSTLAIGTAPFVVTSTTNVANLNASSLNGATFATPGAIGGGTAAAGTFTTLTGNTSITDGGLITAGVVLNSSAGLLSTLPGTTTTVLHGNASGAPTFASITGSDLAANISISTTGNLTTTGSGTITSASTLTGSSGLTLTTGALSLTGTSGSIGLTGFGTTAITSTTTSGDVIAFTDSSLNTAAANLSNFTFKNNNTAAAGLDVNGVTITEQAAAAPLSGTNTSNLLNLTAAANGTVNGINISSATGFTNFIKTPTFNLDSSGNVTGVVGLTATNLTGAIQTASQTNITSVGTLGSLGVTGNINSVSGALQTNTVTRIDNSGVGSLASLSLTTALTVPNGGTGAGTFTLGGVLTGNTTNAVQVTSAGTSGQVLTSNGTGVAPTFQAAASGGSLYNYLTNPGFEIWQRGTGAFTANLAYSSDRWISGIGASTLSVTQEGTIIDSRSKYSMKGVFTYVATSFVYQNVNSDSFTDLAGGLAGQTLTFSARVRSGTASAIRAYIYNGTTKVYSSYHTGGNTFETLTVTATMDVGKSPQVGFELVATNTFYLDNAALVIGSNSLDNYYPLTPQEDMARAQRYYERLGEFQSGTSNWPDIKWSAAGAVDLSWTTTFGVEKAVLPTITINGTWAVVNCGQPILLQVNTRGFAIQVTAAGAGATRIYVNSSDDYIEIVANP